MANTAVLVNEFGEVGLDHHLLRHADEKTVLLEHGCVCCTTREDLVGALLELLDEVDKGRIQSLDRVVVETTGLADPAPILFTVFSHPILQHHYHVERVISTVDAVNGELHLNRNPESTRQATAADVIVLTKTDIAKTDAVRALRARLRSINPSARVIEAPLGEVEPEGLFSRAANWSQTESYYVPNTGANGAAPAPETLAAWDALHVARTHSTPLTFDGPVDWTALGTWFSMLLHARGEDVLRVKGLVDVGEAGPVLLNGVQHVVHPPEHFGEWPDEDRRSRIIFITRGVCSDELTNSLEAFRGILGAGPRLLEANTPV